MRLMLILILFPVFSSCQKLHLGVLKTVDTSNLPLLIISAGESNSAGGLADNSYATPTELSKRPLRILNNTTLLSFDSLQVGVNNQIGHGGSAGGGVLYTAHGIELQLANRYADGDFGIKTVFLVHAGQGGSKISEWQEGVMSVYNGDTAYCYDEWVTRVNAAIALIQAKTGKTPIIKMFWTQGINDIYAGTSSSTWKSATKTLFNQLRNEVSQSFGIYMTQFNSINSAYDATITDISNEMTGVYILNTTGFETSQVVLGAGTHWGYTGMKALSNLFVNGILLSL